MIILNSGAKTMRIEILKARGPGKICSSRSRVFKISGIPVILEDCARDGRFSMFFDFEHAKRGAQAYLAE